MRQKLRALLISIKKTVISQKIWPIYKKNTKPQKIQLNKDILEPILTYFLVKFYRVKITISFLGLLAIDFKKNETQTIIKPFLSNTITLISWIFRLQFHMWYIPRKDRCQKLPRRADIFTQVGNGRLVSLVKKPFFQTANCTFSQNRPHIFNVCYNFLSK